jgi:tRNA nucleotidyltransferase (CCA-adding enzyme)
MKRGNQMQKFLVGGAVRDMLMGLNPKDKDYVIVGSSPEEMLAAGFSQVGADFPVFLHPETGDEYALARREKKTGSGYLGFTSEFGKDVTLEQDLSRRDLTINSMSMQHMEDTEFFVEGDEGNFAVYDPFGGLTDLQNKVLRHTSDAFSEDPVRVLRLARFRARLGSEWTVAPETVTLISQMAKTGVLNELTAERVWKELSRALLELHPRLFFDTLLECDALHVLFPEVYRLKTALESRRWHPEGDAYEHTMLVLTQAANFGRDLDIMLAALVHDFGKGITPRDKLPKHYGHDVNGVPVVEAFCNRLTVPVKMRDAAMAATRYHMNMHKLRDLNAKTFVKMFDDMGAKNDPRKVTVLYWVGICDERGRLGSENVDVSHLSYLLDVWKAVQNVRFADVFPNGETNVSKIKDGLYRAKVQAVAKVA